MGQRFARVPALAPLDGESGSVVAHPIMGLGGGEVVHRGVGDIIQARVVERDVLGVAVEM